MSDITIKGSSLSDDEIQVIVDQDISGIKADCTIAKVASEVAQTASELAQTNAEAAQIASESARDLSQVYASNSSSSASSASISASNASSSALSASGYADVATTQSGIATTKASEASSSASNASASALNASASESNALASASNASTSETNAATYRDESLVSRNATFDKYGEFVTAFWGADITSNLPIDKPTGTLAYDLTLTQLVAWNGSAWVGATKGDSVTDVTSSKVGTTTTISVYIEDALAHQFDIEDGQEAYTDAEIKTKYENNADTNAYTDTEKSKLSGIEDNATSDQTDVEISALMKDYTETMTNKTINDASNNVHANATHLKVKATENITKGQPVIVTGYNVGEDALNVELANQSTGVATGIAEETMLSGEFGTMIMSGVLHNIDTSSFSEGSILYVDGTGVLTSTEPTSGFSQPLAYVLRSNANNGAIQINAAYPKQDGGDVRYDNTTSGFTATTIQTAIDELNSSLTTTEEW